MKKEKLLVLAEKFINGTASAEEKNQLHSWYDATGDGEETISLHEPGSKESIRNKILLRIQQQLDRTSPPASRSTHSTRRLFRNMSAAAVLVSLLFAAVYYLYFQPKPEKKLAANPPAAVLHDAEPGGNKALLTLADGTNIVLDSAQNGNLTRQGNTVVYKRSNGQLEYNQHGVQKAVAGIAVLYNKISTPRGGQYQLVLPDGSKVWLNAASSLRYPTSFTGKERKVELTGEAYFEINEVSGGIAGAAKIPFTVSLNGMDVQVLGTHFNINAYADESSIKTTLLEGKVEVRSTQNMRQVLSLAPGQQSQCDNSGNIKLLKNADTEQAIAWKNGMFKFNSADLQTIMRQVGRWYDVEVNYEGGAGNESFSGEMPRKEFISQVLKMLEMTKTVQFSIENKKVIIKPYKK